MCWVLMTSGTLSILLLYRILTSKLLWNIQLFYLLLSRQIWFNYKTGCNLGNSFTSTKAKMCHNIQHNYTYSCTLHLILQHCNSPAIICERKGANQCCGRTHVCYSHTHWFTFVLKTISAEDCHGKRSMTCNWRMVEAAWSSINTCPCSITKVILLIARAACAFVSCGFSSYSAWWRSLTRRLHNSF